MMNNMLKKQMLEKLNCEKCRFSTKDPNKYRNHVSLHNDIKYACSHCDFVSYTKTEFQRHLVTHTGKFPYTCGYCGYGAIRNDYIVKHIRRIHGDGKIQCSVSTVENESKKASINITQTQVMAPIVHNLLQNSQSLLTEDVIDLTTEVDCSSNNIYFPNGHIDAGHVEVEVISPVDQPLYPGLPLTVVAPTSFRAPTNCIVQVVDVKPVNSACHLVLKCLNLVESNLPLQPIKSEHIYEQKSLKPDMPSKKIIENPSGPLLQESAVSHNDCQKNVSYPSNTICETQENLNTNLTCPIDNTNEIINPIESVVNDMFDDLEEFSGGPIISAVFSLSSDSQNTIEGIQWESPFSSPNTSSSNDNVDAAHSSLNSPESPEGPTVCGSKLNCQIDHDKSQDVPKNTVLEPTVCGSELNRQINLEKSLDVLKNTVLESEKEPPEIEMENVKESTDPEIPLSKSVPSDVKNLDGQPFALQKTRKGGRISNRLGKMEMNNFTKPQTLFLSCDKRIVMQPLSCTMQNSNDTTPPEGNVTEQSQVPVKMRKESARVKLKRLVVPAMKSRPQLNLRTLRLHPVKEDQVAHAPCYNQPVVVLNHPDVESVETFHIMKTIREFEGKIKKVTLSKQLCKTFV